MSDSDDWEKNAEKDDEAIGDILKTGKFGDEISAPIVEEVKQAPPPAPKKTYEDKLAKKKKEKKPAETKETEEDKQKRMLDAKKKEEESDHKNTEDLFDVKPVQNLVTDDDYIDYAREVSRKLHTGNHHFRLPVFFIELVKETAALMRAEDVNKVITQMNVVHSEKVRTEKGGTKKTNNKPSLKADTKKAKINMDEDEENEYDEFEDFL